MFFMWFRAMKVFFVVESLYNLCLCIFKTVTSDDSRTIKCIVYSNLEKKSPLNQHNIYVSLTQTNGYLQA